MSTKTAKATETTEAPASAGKGKVFSVSAKKGPLETVRRSVAIDDCTGDNFTAETCETLLSQGDVIFSDEFYYAEDSAKLKKWIKDAPVNGDAPATTDTPGPATAKANAEAVTETEVWNPGQNEVAVNIKTGVAGQILIDGEKVTVNWKDAKGKDKSAVYDPKKFRKATHEEFFAFTNTETALEKVDGPQDLAPAGDESGDDAINGEAVLEPLNKTERKRLEKLEQAYEEVDGVERQIPFQKGAILNEIRQSRLFRESYQTFGEYALARFGITREYAQNLAQISGIPDLAAEALGDGAGSLNLSVNAANELMRDGNKMAKALGIGRVETEAVAPIIRNILALAVDVAPRNEQTGEIEMSPRFISEFNKTIASHLTDGVIEIDGQQMTVKDAGEKGLLNASLRSEVLQSAAESIRTNSATIISEYKEAEANAESNIPNGGGDGDSETKYYKGKVPTLETQCTKHGDTEVMSVGAGKIVTRCGCKWHMDANSGSLVAYEVDDKRVKPRA